MNRELVSALDEGILLVLGSRLAKAVSLKEWDSAIGAIALMEPVAARAGGRSIRRFQRAVFMLAKSLPVEHPREQEFVARAQQFLDSQRDDDEESGRPARRIPVGQMPPQPLPVVGEMVEEEQLYADIKTVLATFPDFSLLYRGRPFAHRITTISFFPAWHLAEFQLRQSEGEDAMPLASRAFLVKGDDIFPIKGDVSVLLAIAQAEDFDLSTPERAKQYLALYISIYRLGDAPGIAGRIVEPGGFLPFYPDIDPALRAEVEAKVAPCEVRESDAGGFTARGTMMLSGNLARFEATIGSDGTTHIHEIEGLVTEAAGQDGSKRRILLDNVYYEEGWRTVEARRATIHDNAAASGEEIPASLPTTLPSAEEGESRQRRPCVVTPPGIRTFAGLPLQAIDERDRDVLEAIGRDFSGTVLDGFDLEKARTASLPFLPSHTLVLVPHRLTDVGVPFVVGDGVARLAGRANSWLYDLMQKDGVEPSESVIIPYAKFFLAVISGVQGRFDIVESVDEVPWSDAATEDDRQRLHDVLAPVRYLGRLADGRFVLSMHVVFKHALFRTNYEIARDWVGKFTKEDLVFSDQPFLKEEFGGLMVRK